ncbi:serine/threonine-protein kinase [Actinomyces timonensis]|uniref:non-specific serine/threonine protein kinase n=1 Tax=Actinomyces timonensis TaxID=1288391 RepID=A0AAU8N4J7_9ACTO
MGLELQGRYQLLERIALGGMGEVWRATDLNSGRIVAAKILRPELTGDEIFLSRLRAEAANSRGLRHPNLAVVLDFGERKGSGWIIMELVQGRALSDILEEKGTMAPAEILPILAQVARALQVVHDTSVVHRDVKPSNILINREGLAKLTDFGISTGPHQRPMTATGMVMGTAQYLAPEQAMGNAAQPSGDLYALGIIAYEALVGRRPFTGSTQVDIAFAHVNDPVPPMPKSVPPEVRQVVMELLAKKPADRPASARELARRLDRIVIHLPEEHWDPEDSLAWASTGRSARGPGTASTAGGASGAAGSGRASSSTSLSAADAATDGESAASAPSKPLKAAERPRASASAAEWAAAIVETAPKRWPERRPGIHGTRRGAFGSRARALPVSHHARDARRPRRSSGRGRLGLPLLSSLSVPALLMLAGAVLILIAAVIALVSTLASAQPGTTDATHQPPTTTGSLSRAGSETIVRASGLPAPVPVTSVKEAP